MTEDVSVEIDRLLADPKRRGRGHRGDWADLADPLLDHAMELVVEVVTLGRQLKITQGELSGLFDLTRSQFSRVMWSRIQRRELEPLIATAEEIKVALERRLAERD